MPRRILVLGATSAIAHALCRRWAARGERLCLVARDAGRLRIVADDLRVRGAAQVAEIESDLDALETHPSLVARAADELGGLDTALVAWGVLGDADRCRRDPAAAVAVLRTNLVAPASILTALAERFERSGSGSIVVIGSVAGDRGRQSNYVYGASKGGLAVLLQGLRNRLHPAGVRVLTVKPGFVDTPMTADVPKNPLFASAETIAIGIDRAERRGRTEVYLPWFWRPLMFAIRIVPEPLFKRLRL